MELKLKELRASQLGLEVDITDQDGASRRRGAGGEEGLVVGRRRGGSVGKGGVGVGEGQGRGWGWGEVGVGGEVFGMGRCVGER